MSEEYREIPHGQTYERSVLSCLLKDPERIQTTESLADDLFFLPPHKILFRRLTELVGAGREIELTALRQVLHDEGELDAIGGPAALVDVYGYATHTGHFTQHLAELHRYRALRLALALSDEIAEAAWSLDAEAVLEATGEPVSDLHDLITGASARQDSLSVLQTVWTRWEALCRGETPPQGILTSLGELNHRFGGLHSGDTIVISGYPGTGKSVLSSQLALDAALDGHRILALTLEMSAEQWMQRALAYAAHLPGQALSDPLSYCQREYEAEKVTKEVVGKAKRGVQALRQNLPAVEHMGGPNASQCAAIIRREHRKQPVRVVILDFIQRMRARPGHEREGFERVLADAAQSLADLARELGFTLIMGSQLSKDGAAKWAEAINEAADLHLKIDRDAKKNPAGIFVEKDRHHGQGGQHLDIYLQPEMIRFSQGKPVHVEEEPATRV